MPKQVLAFDIDQTLNIAKTPIPPEIAEVLTELLEHYKICPISGQKFGQFLIQIVDPILAYADSAKISRADIIARLGNLHLFTAQGTQYFRYIADGKSDLPCGSTNSDITPSLDPSVYCYANWFQVYSYPLKEEDVVKITTVLEEAARELGFWEADKLKPGDEIIENRLSQVTFSALGQKAGTKEKYAWDPDCKKRERIVKRCQQKLPDFLYEIGGTTSINVAAPGMNKSFGMKHLLEELGVEKSDVLYFGDMTKPGGNDYPVVEMGIDTITVRSHEDTLYALRGILAIA